MPAKSRSRAATARRRANEYRRKVRAASRMRYGLGFSDVWGGIKRLSPSVYNAASYGAQQLGRGAAWTGRKIAEVSPKAYRAALAAGKSVGEYVGSASRRAIEMSPRAARAAMALGRGARRAVGTAGSLATLPARMAYRGARAGVRNFVPGGSAMVSAVETGARLASAPARWALRNPGKAAALAGTALLAGGVMAGLYDRPEPEEVKSTIVGSVLGDTAESVATYTGRGINAAGRFVNSLLPTKWQDSGFEDPKLLEKTATELGKTQGSLWRAVGGLVDSGITKVSEYSPTLRSTLRAKANASKAIDEAAAAGRNLWDLGGAVRGTARGAYDSLRHLSRGELMKATGSGVRAAYHAARVPIKAAGHVFRTGKSIGQSAQAAYDLSEPVRRSLSPVWDGAKWIYRNYGPTDLVRRIGEATALVED